MLHKRGIKITNVVEMTDLNYPAVFIAVTQNHVFAPAGYAVNHAVGVPVVTVKLPNSTRTPLDAQMRQMWLDLLRWMSERAGERVLPSGSQQRIPKIAINSVAACARIYEARGRIRRNIGVRPQFPPSLAI